MVRGPNNQSMVRGPNNHSMFTVVHHDDKRADIPYTKEQITNVFKSHDKDGNGLLSKAELDAAFTKLGALWPGFRSWRGLKHADANDDGVISIADELGKLVDYALSLGYTIA